MLFELDADALVPFKSRTNTFSHTAEYPMTEYDVSLLFDSEIKWADMLQTLRGFKSELFHGAAFVDEYKGKQIPAGKKSVTIRLTIGSLEKTLTSTEIEECASGVIKKLTKRLGAELRTIHEKIDAQFALFRQAAQKNDGMDVRAAILMPLVLDEYAEPEGEAQARATARQCGLLRDEEDKPCYTVMVSSLLNEDGGNCTTHAFVASVDRLAAKYLRSVSFFTSGKVISVLLGNPSDFQEYLHILADEISQMADRVLGRRCYVGVSRETWNLSGLHGAYREAMEALRQGEGAEGGVQFISDLSPAVKGGSLLCKRALDALDQNYADADLSLVSLSGMLDVSPNHLSACIKKYAGETFINILIRKRMDAARELIATSSLKIQEISQRCGYIDQHYFSYCFKKYCGESPNAMRRRLDREKAGERS